MILDSAPISIPCGSGSPEFFIFDSVLAAFYIESQFNIEPWFHAGRLLTQAIEVPVPGRGAGPGPTDP
ncbi:hypothetical protein SCA03_16110 [Streptomyces cacaoi]|uniref:Uncharacterized protein n=1 Tax=Streptomyces cacaoi TaxID=1898 RepID=A0A4Y3QYP4_STRCI|nr:hypothetical protein SCA03_16110 [Streptomyces cacaoi]